MLFVFLPGKKSSDENNMGKMFGLGLAVLLVFSLGLVVAGCAANETPVYGSNLISNGDFEGVGFCLGQACMPGGWASVGPNPPADGNSNDGSFGIGINAYGHFVGNPTPFGNVFVAAWSRSGDPEYVYQTLASPLEVGAEYYVSGWLLNAWSHDDVGAYRLSVGGLPSGNSFSGLVDLGAFANTVSGSEGWVNRDFSFVASAGVAGNSVLVFTPVPSGDDVYPGLDNVSLRKLVGCNASCVPGVEVCDGVDNDCDGLVDEGVKNACGGCGAVPVEICGNGIDENCDGVDDSCGVNITTDFFIGGWYIPGAPIYENESADVRFNTSRVNYSSASVPVDVFVDGVKSVLNSLPFGDPSLDWGINLGVLGVGNHNLSIVVDPNDTIVEVDESNNVFEFLFDVEKLPSECFVDSNCSDDYYEERYCSGDDVYRKLHDFSCVSGSCVDNVSEVFVKECDDYCRDGKCKRRGDEDYVNDSVNYFVGSSGVELGLVEVNASDGVYLENGYVDDVGLFWVWILLLIAGIVLLLFVIVWAGME